MCRIVLVVESVSVSVFEFVFEGGWRGRRAKRVTGRNDGPRATRTPRLPRFDHHRLDAFSVARDALRLGEKISKRLPRGYATLSDQLRRALLSAYLGIAEASSRVGSDRVARFRCARGEASEAAAALEAVQVLELAPNDEIEAVLRLLDRLCAMLTRLAGLGHRSKDSPGADPRARPRDSPSNSNSNTDTDTDSTTNRR
jgi:four helix bundle protein